MNIKKDLDKYIVSANTNEEDVFVDMLMSALKNTYCVTISRADSLSANREPLETVCQQKTS